MAEAGSLDDILGKEDVEINELLKNAGVADPDGLLDLTAEPEKVPEPVENGEDLHAETPEPEKEPEPETPPPEKEPEPEPAPVKEPEPEPEPPREVKPRREQVPIWKVLRDAEKRNRDLEAENQRLKAERQARPEPLTEDYNPAAELEENDPIIKLQREQEALKERLAQQEATNRQTQLTQQIVTDENNFRQVHPDYNDAIGFLTTRARQRFLATGEIDEKMTEVLSQHHEVIDNVLATRGIHTPTDEQVMQTAEDIAFAVLFEQERQKFVNRVSSRGKSVAAEAYKLAESEGYKAKTAAEPTPEPPPQAKKETDATDAQKRVARQAEIAKANQSLSAMQNAGVKRSTVPRTKTEFMKMTPEAQDRLIEQMETVDPDWHQKLAD